MTMLHRALALAALCHAARGTPTAFPDERARKLARCKRSRTCERQGGRCAASCVPSPTVGCAPDLCLGAKCTCAMKDPCPEATKCEAHGGRCVKNCKEVPGVIKCDDICDPGAPASPHKCMCEIEGGDPPPCEDVNNECAAAGGWCADADDCHPLFAQCDESLCGNGDGCVCVLPRYCMDENNDENNECATAGGECVDADDCFGVVDRCDESLCGRRDGCVCKIPRFCMDENNECATAGGECVDADDCSVTLRQCDESLCGSGDGCVCKIPQPVLQYCFMDARCGVAGGECVDAGDCDLPSECVEQIRDKRVCSRDSPYSSDTCVCKIQPCTVAGGECVDAGNCDFPSNCDESLCGNGEVCEIPQAPQGCKDENNECAAAGGECVKDCEEAPGVVCLDFCKPEDPSSPPGTCMCKVDLADPSCDDDQWCRLTGGYCTTDADDCDTTLSVCNINEDWCGDGCVCKREKCTDDGCSAAGGMCFTNYICNVNQAICDESLCGDGQGLTPYPGDFCVCVIPLAGPFN